MEILYTTQLSVPLFQVVLLLFLIALSTLFGRMKMAILITYLFTLYWGYFSNRDLLFNFIQDLEYFVFIYFGFGILVAILAIVGFMAHES